MALGTTSKEPPIGFHPEVPKVFSCLEEARNSFDYHWNGCVRIFNDWENLEQRKKEVEGKYKTEQQEFLKIFQAWEKAFEAFLHDKWATMDKIAQSGSRVLQMMQVTAYVSLDSFGYDVEEELVWDKYLHSFKKNCDLAEAILANDKRKLPYFCLEMNFVAPLYAVAHKCRDPGQIRLSRSSGNCQIRSHDWSKKGHETAAIHGGLKLVRYSILECSQEEPVWPQEFKELPWIR